MKKMTLLSIPITFIFIALIEFVSGGTDASLLPGLALVTATVQGMLVFPAAAELSHGKWHVRLKPFLLKIYPILFLFPFTFLIFSRNLSIYPWASHPPNGWLTDNFMVWRNFVMLLITAIFGTFFSIMSEKQNSSTGKWAVLYLLSYVITNTLIGIDWVMSLEYPWISTMFPALYFVEGGMLGIAVTLLFMIFTGLAGKEEFKSVLRDYSILMLGFGLFWGGLQYAQYLTIWYGNIPEEVSYFYHRLHDPSTKNLVVLVLFLGFVVPFIGLIPKKVKTWMPYLASVSILVITGLFLERFIHVSPVAKVYPVKMVVELLVLFIPVLVSFYDFKKLNNNR